MSKATSPEYTQQNIECIGMITIYFVRMFSVGYKFITALWNECSDTLTLYGNALCIRTVATYTSEYSTSVVHNIMYLRSHLLY